MAVGEKKILLLGTGFVAGPFLSYMLRKPENKVTVACRHVEAAKGLCQGKKNVTAIALDVNDAAALDEQVAKHDVVVSLIPYIFHALVIESAIRNKKNVCTTSYVSPAMQALDGKAKEAGITVMNEIGVDPGVDHVYAMKVIDEVHEKGGKVLSFVSYCGGLPAPEDSNNPLGYKFSWSPRGVLLAIRNAAKFKRDGKIVSIDGPELLLKGPEKVVVYPAFALEGYPNRDSSFYDTRYGMPECQTVLRGSLRYQGNPRFMLALGDLGFLNDEAQAFLNSKQEPLTWLEVMGKLLGCSSDYASVESAVVKKAKLEGEDRKRILRGMRWLGLLTDARVHMRGTYLDVLCGTLEDKMMYGEKERDMVLLQHTFEIEWADGSEETRTSTMLEYGVPGGEMAMARTVGVPCGIATQLILDGKLCKKGILAPLTKDIYGPLIVELEKEGINCVEEVI
eukprot:Nk52_evm109s224 gene=Nk52_evmTU109s224